MPRATSWFAWRGAAPCTRFPAGDGAMRRPPSFPDDPPASQHASQPADHAMPCHASPPKQRGRRLGA
eukprot:364379-Chlamydomonas_euryale.AAC.7